MNALRKSPSSEECSPMQKSTPAQTMTQRATTPGLPSSASSAPNDSLRGIKMSSSSWTPSPDSPELTITEADKPTTDKKEVKTEVIRAEESSLAPSKCLAEFLRQPEIPAPLAHSRFSQQLSSRRTPEPTKRFSKNSKEPETWSSCSTAGSPNNTSTPP